jgi:hypothetical protein
MKGFLIAALLAVAITPAFSADVGVSISVGQPGFYGRIDIGDFPRPTLIYPQPVVIQPAPPGIVHQPIYLRVPPGHAKHWRKYCHRYNACGRPVYFVQDRWYNDVYVPRYRERHAERHHREIRHENRGNRKPGHENRDRGRDRNDR